MERGNEGDVRTYTMNHNQLLEVGIVGAAMTLSGFVHDYPNDAELGAK